MQNLGSSGCDMLFVMATKTIVNSALDWRMPNNLLAERAGVTRESIRQWRKKLGAPRPLFVAQIRLARYYAQIVERADEIHGLPKSEAERILGFSFNTQALRSFAWKQAKLTQGKHPWNRMNFHLPSGVLAAIWGATVIEVHTERRRNKRPEAKWRAARNKTLLLQQEFREAKQAEEVKARLFRREKAAQ